MAEINALRDYWEMLSGGSAQLAAPGDTFLDFATITTGGHLMFTYEKHPDGTIHRFTSVASISETASVLTVGFGLDGVGGTHNVTFRKSPSGPSQNGLPLVTATPTQMYTHEIDYSAITLQGVYRLRFFDGYNIVESWALRAVAI
jgi:hypothetical protein